MKNLIFVYGTLMTRGRNNWLMIGSDFVGTGFVMGRLYNLGHYPGALPAVKDGKCQVHGEFYMVSDANRDNLDKLEGFIAPGNIYNLYDRKKVNGIMNGEKVGCSMYLYNGEVLENQEIKSGQWFTGRKF